MLSGGALVAEARHTLLGVGAFSYVSAGLGFGGGAGIGSERERTAGQTKNGNKKDEEPKTKCHWNHCHLDTLENSVLPLFFRGCIVGQNIKGH